MQIEWLIFLSIVGCAALIIIRSRASPLWRWMVVSLCGATLLGGYVIQNRAIQKVALRPAEKVPQIGRPGGYITSDNCGSCHPSQHESWHRSFHRTMTQYPNGGNVLGNFNNVDLEIDGAKLHLERGGEQYWVTMNDPDWMAQQARISLGILPGVATNSAAAPRVKKQVTLMTGSHNFQVYWVPGESGNMQYSLPFAWLISEKRWVPRNDSFVRDPESPPLTQIWNINCIQCHSTGGQPRRDKRDGKLATRVGEMGIACEACHGPAEQHVALNRSPSERYLKHFGKKQESAIVNPKRLSTKASTEVCGQCHSMRWNLFRDEWMQEGFSFRPGDNLQKTLPLLRPSKFDEQTWLPEGAKKDTETIGNIFWPDGMIRVTGREYSGLIESPCHQKGQMTCLSCHSIHQSDPNRQLAAQMEGNKACLQCHEKLGRDLAAHTHHNSNSIGSSCYNCHMPYATYGLLRSVRNHFIESPSAKKTVETGRPNGCNLCHLDKTLQWSADHLSDWYGAPRMSLEQDEQRIASSVLMAARGNVAQRALVAAAFGWEAARKASGQEWSVPLLVQLMDDPYSAVRFIAYNSLRQNARFAGCRFDYIGDGSAREAARARILEKWRGTRPEKTGESLLTLTNGALNDGEFARLLQSRDNRRMNLVE